ncbi:hypothetical protein BGZ83_012047, partial [Gryganskiella cystojenkinii]
MAASSLALTNDRADITTHVFIDPYRSDAIIHDRNINSPSGSTTTLTESVPELATAANPCIDSSEAELCQPTSPRRTDTPIESQLMSLNSSIKLANQSGRKLQAEAMQDSIGKHLVPSTTSDDTQQYLVQNVGILVRDVGELRLQGNVLEQLARKMVDMQQQVLDRLRLIQSKTEAILTQQLELTEYPIPRLFIVLPEEPAKYDPGNWFRTKFRLYFICECGKHTETNSSKVPHYLHLAKHEGYLIREPTKFFKKYGPFLLLMLELIKFGTDIAGHVVPALASLKIVELADSVKETVESVAAKIDYSLECIDKQLDKVQASSPGDIIDTEPRAAMTQQDLNNYLSEVRGLEGVELRQLGSFLKELKEGNYLGNLYRISTLDGHVKWVCLDHRGDAYQNAHTQKLREVVKLGRGTFDDQMGRIEITLESSFAATEFYNCIHKAKGVLELILKLKGDCSRNDLDGLESALKKSRVSILRLDFQHLQTGFRNRFLPTSTRYDVLFRISELPNMKTIHFGTLPKDVTRPLSFQSSKRSHLRRVSFGMHLELIGERELRGFAEDLKTNSNLTALNLESNLIGDKGTLTLADALKTNNALTTLDLQHNSIGDDGAQALADALKTNPTLIILDLSSNQIGDNGAQMLADALKTNSTLITLNVRYNLIWLKGLLAFFEAFKTNSTLATLDLRGNLIKDTIAEALLVGEALTTNSTLTTLDLQLNSIGDDGALSLSDALETNSTLTSLNLYGNSIEDNGAMALANALKTNPALTTLDLFSNRIGDNGAQTMAEALKTNSTLTTLS